VRFLGQIQRHPGIDLEGKTIYREAVRAIIQDGRRLLMIYSTVNCDYKFPGGGVNPGESDHEALIREVKEESGARVSSIDGEYGLMLEYDFPSEPDYDTFKMVSRYYRCSILPGLEEQALDDYERDLDFRPVWIDIDEAIHNNRSILARNDHSVPRWTARDTQVLEQIRRESSEGCLSGEPPAGQA
jgi:8-oxo-dGTP pyrophosphatase MutT (NUDIX family)